LGVQGRGDRSVQSAPTSHVAEARRSKINAFGIEYEGKSAVSSSTSPWPPAKVIEPADERRRDTAGLAPAFAAARARLGLVTLLFILAVSAWWFTLDRMRGMDDGPGTELGPLGWFLSVWVVMMAAMMFPSVSPTVALYSRMTRTRAPLAPLVFTFGYLLYWSAAGVVAFAISNLGAGLLRDELSWDRAGRWVAGSILAAAALYELTPLKDVCLGKCRSPLGFLLGSWRGGLSGALQMGAKHGAWCVGCCWALMAALFALGVMSIAWMAFVAALIAAEKMLPWRRAATYGTAVILLLLAVMLIAAPDAIPGLTIPESGSMK
jgi:predicted metal-binding membrane protein